MSRELDSPEFSPLLCLFMLAALQHEQSASHLIAHKTKMMMTITVDVSALHEFVKRFGKLEGPYIVILMENMCV